MENLNNAATKTETIQHLAAANNVEIEVVSAPAESGFHPATYDTRVIAEYCGEVVPDNVSLIENLNPCFFEAEFIGIPIKMVEAINESRIGTTTWDVQVNGITYYGVTFHGEKRKPKTLREAIESCVTEYNPSYRVIINSEGITFILTKEERDDLVFAVDNAMKL